jgi:hypothetical protein
MDDDAVLLDIDTPEALAAPGGASRQMVLTRAKVPTRSLSRTVRSRRPHAA